MIQSLKNKLQNNSLFKSLSVYTTANLLNAGIPFFLLPILTTYLSTSDYGILTNFQVLLSFSIPFIIYGVDGAVLRQYIDKEQVKFANYLTNTIYIIIAGTATYSIVIYIFRNQISGLTEIPVKWIFLIIPLAFFTGIINVVLALWRAQIKAIRYSVFKILKTILDLSLSIVLIIYVYTSWESRISAQIIATIIIGLLIIYFLFKEKYISLKLNKEYIKSALSYGAPLIPHTIGAVIIALSDRLFITKMVGISDVGIYSAGYQIGAVILLFQDSFNQAWVPWLFQKLKENNFITKLKIVKFTYIYFVAIIILVLILTFIAPFIVDVFLGKDFRSAEQFIFWIALGFAFNGMYKMVVNYLFYLKRTKIIGLITISVAILNIILNYFFISLNGTIGAAQATATSFFVLFIVVWIISAKKYKMPWFYFLKK